MERQALKQRSALKSLTTALDVTSEISSCCLYHRYSLSVALVGVLGGLTARADAQNSSLNHSGAANNAAYLVAFLSLTIVVHLLLSMRDRKSTNSLIETQQRLEFATRSNGIGTWERDLRTDSITWDDTMLGMYGISRSDFQGSPTWLNLVHPDDHDKLAAALNSAGDDGCSLNIEFKIVRADTRVRYIKSTGEVVRSEQGLPLRVRGCNEDVTEIILAEKEQDDRRASDIELHNKLVTLHEVVNELSRAESTDDFTLRAVKLAHSHLGFDRLGIWYYDAENFTMRGSYGIGEDGQIRDERGKVFKMSREINQDYLHMVSDQMTIEFHDDVELYDDSTNVIARGQSIRASIWDGRRGIGLLSFDNLLSGQPISSVQREIASLYASAVGHMYARRLADDALGESEVRLKMAVDAANTGIWAWDMVSNSIYWSDTTCQIFGLDPESAPTTYDDIVKLIHEDDRESVSNTVRETIKQGTKFNIAHRVVKPDGTIRWVEGHGHISRNADGCLTRMTGTVVDISERRRLEEALLQSNKLESIGRLAGGIAHDFNNMLAVIIGYAEIIHDEVESNANLEPCISNILSTAERAAELTAQLLAFARKQVVVSRTIDLNTILTGAERIADRFLPSHITFKLFAWPTPVWICADPA